MCKSNRALIASAVAAVWIAAPAYGQTTTLIGGLGGPHPVEVKTNAKPEERAFAVIQSVDNSKRSPEAIPVGTADLVRARAAGEMQATERSGAGVTGRVQSIRVEASENARAPAEVHSPAGGQAQAKTRGAVQPSIVYADGESKDRTKTQAVVRIDDVARSREHAKYEAEKNQRRAAEKAASAAGEQVTARATEQARAVEDLRTGVSSGQARSEVSWSVHDQAVPRAMEVEIR